MAKLRCTVMEVQRARQTGMSLVDMTGDVEKDMRSFDLLSQDVGLLAENKYRKNNTRE